MRRLTLPTLVFLAAIPAAIPAACAAPVTTTPAPLPPPAQACTKIGCEDGWNVELMGAAALPATYTIRVLVGGAVVASVQCTPMQPCGEQLFVTGVTAAEAELEIIGGELPLRWTVTPEYNMVQPNGPNCPPTCRQARVQVRLTGSQ